MADVAQAAGVSHQTVSRVINGADSVRPETRERVLAAMRAARLPAELTRPCAGHRAFADARRGELRHDAVRAGLDAVRDRARRARPGYFVSIVSVTSLDRDLVLGAVDRLRGQGVDGVLLITPQERAAEAFAHLPRELPVVAVEAGPEETVPVVTVDQVAGAQAATRHLLELGHRTVWHLAGPSDWLEAQQRVDGWMAALAAAGADPPPLLSGDWSARSGYELGQRLAGVRRRDGDLRRQRPDGARACCGPCTRPAATCRAR